jgi:PAS domain S-box-containing protein
MYDNNPLMLFTLSVEGFILEVNPAVERQLGYTEEEIIGKNVLSVFHPDEHTKVVETIKEYLLNPVQDKPWEFRKVSKSGKIIWVSETTQMLYDSNGSPTILVVCKDITYRREVEQKLIINQERLNLALLGAGDGIWDWDIVNETVYYSPSWEKMFGFANGEAKPTL